MPRVAQASPTALCDSVGPQWWTKGLLRAGRGKCISPARRIFTDNRLSTQEESAHCRLWHFNRPVQPEPIRRWPRRGAVLRKDSALPIALSISLKAVASGTPIRRMRSRVDIDVPNSTTAAFQRNSNGRRNTTASVSMPDMAKIGTPSAAVCKQTVCGRGEKISGTRCRCSHHTVALSYGYARPLNARLC